MDSAISVDAFNQVRSDVDDLNQTVYRGNGTPGLVSRMTKVESSVATLSRVGWLAIGAMFTACGLIAADLITRLLK